MGVIPFEKFLLEYLMRCTDGPAVVCSRHFPQDYVGIVPGDCPGMPDWNIAVLLPVNKQDRDTCSSERLLGRYLIQAQTILPACAEEGNFNHWP